MRVTINNCISQVSDARELHVPDPYMWHQKKETHTQFSTPKLLKVDVFVGQTFLSSYCNWQRRVSAPAKSWIRIAPPTTTWRKSGDMATHVNTIFDQHEAHYHDDRVLSLTHCEQIAILLCWWCQPVGGAFDILRPYPQVWSLAPGHAPWLCVQWQTRPCRWQYPP